MIYLMDVSTLLAAIWRPHVHHARVDAWLTGKSTATCPLSELGFLRISTHPTGPIQASMTDTRHLLESFMKLRKTAFVPDDESSLNSISGSHAQVTDAYLAHLAAKHSMQLASLDQRIKHPAVLVIP